MVLRLDVWSGPTQNSHNHQHTKKFQTTTTHRLHLNLDSFIDRRLCYVNYPNCKFVLHNFGEVCNIKIFSECNLQGSRGWISTVGTSTPEDMMDAWRIATREIVRLS